MAEKEQKRRTDNNETRIYGKNDFIEHYISDILHTEFWKYCWHVKQFLANIWDERKKQNRSAATHLDNF